jgi:hypothetical protein
MGYRVLNQRDVKWQPRKGLEGPFFYSNGRVLYYSPADGEYWDPTTDFFVPNEEVASLMNLIVEILKK